ncbi:MAG TPA: MacB family efflux pump subunit [Burkholderiaceae bacterium]|nr:MacB family efflux pump subunit [Burkholderiaceae bacterium]
MAHEDRLRARPRPLKPILKLTGVCKSHWLGEREVKVLRDIDLTLHAGVMVAIVGPSGSGKSTLMNILGCLDQPSSGCYKLAGRDTRSLDGDQLARLRRRLFGFVFQRYHLLPNLSVQGNIEMPAIYTGIPAEKREARAIELLKRLGLGAHLDHLPNQLSGGQQQRVAIARAIMNGGGVILADEPTGALDSQTGRETLQILLELQEQGHTVILVTHDRQVAACAERIIELKDGCIVADQVNPHRTVASSGRRVRRHRLKGRRAPLSLWRHVVEAFAMARLSLACHRMRTALTMLGIVIGIASVVAIMAVGEGSRRHMEETIGAFTSNLIEIRRGGGWNDAGATGIHTLLPGDIDALLQQPYVDSTTPLTRSSFTVRHRDADTNVAVSGVGDGYFKVRNVALAAGRPLNADDIHWQTQVAVIDPETRRQLFHGTENPIGQVIIVGNVPCTVVGVTSPAGQYAGAEPNVLMPYTTAAVRLFGRPFFDSIVVRLTAGRDSRLIEQGLARLLMYKHGVKDFFTNNMDNLAKGYESTTRAVSLMLSLVASIALLVGGVGLMNIMLVSVNERTREIGIRMAVGARRSDIAKQFLAEAVAICLIGGVLGIGLALAAGPVFSAFVTEWRMVFTPGSIVLAFLCSTTVGLIFGLLPARKGSQLNPSEALSRE